MQDLHAMSGMVPGLRIGTVMSDQTVSTVSAEFDCVHEPVTYPFTMLFLSAERTCMQIILWATQLQN